MYISVILKQLKLPKPIQCDFHTFIMFYVILHTGFSPCSFYLNWTISYESPAFFATVMPHSISYTIHNAWIGCLNKLFKFLFY